MKKVIVLLIVMAMATGCQYRAMKIGTVKYRQLDLFQKKALEVEYVKGTDKDGNETVSVKLKYEADANAQAISAAAAAAGAAVAAALKKTP